MFGVFGLLMGVPILAVISYVFTRLTDKHMKKKELVTEAEYYLEVDRFDTEKGEFVLIDKEKKMQEKMNKVKPRNEKIAGMWNSFINRFKRKNNKDE